MASSQFECLQCDNFDVALALTFYPSLNAELIFPSLLLTEARVLVLRISWLFLDTPSRIKFFSSECLGEIP